MTSATSTTASTAIDAKALATKAKSLARAYSRFRFPEKEYVVSQRSLQDLRTIAGELPAARESFDWREQVPVSSPRDQEPCNACTSFAIAAAIEICRLRTDPDTPIIVSAGYIHTCLGHAEDTDPQSICAFGIDLYRALRLVKEKGYVAGETGNYPFAPGACRLTNANGTIGDFFPVADKETAQSIIPTFGPVVADMYIWNDFFDYTTTRAAAYSPKSVGERPYLHSVCVIGFNTAGWLIQNSFGRNWGDGRGCGTIAYGSCGLLGAPPPKDGVERQAFAIRL